VRESHRDSEAIRKNLPDISSAVLRRWVTEALAAESGRAKGPAREKNAVKRRLILVLSLLEWIGCTPSMGHVALFRFPFLISGAA
jgi:hypothetical protein